MGYFARTRISISWAVVMLGRMLPTVKGGGCVAILLGLLNGPKVLLADGRSRVSSLREGGLGVHGSAQMLARHQGAQTFQKVVQGVRKNCRAFTQDSLDVAVALVVADHGRNPVSQI